MIVKTSMVLLAALTPALAAPAPAPVSLDPPTIIKRANDFSSSSSVKLSPKCDDDLPISPDSDSEHKGYLFLEAGPFREEPQACVMCWQPVYSKTVKHHIKLTMRRCQIFTIRVPWTVAFRGNSRLV